MTRQERALQFLQDEMVLGDPLDMAELEDRYTVRIDLAVDPWDAPMGTLDELWNRPWSKYLVVIDAGSEPECGVHDNLGTIRAFLQRWYDDPDEGRFAMTKVIDLDNGAILEIDTGLVG